VALLAADGSEIKGASFAWTSYLTIVTVVPTSDKATAATASIMEPVGTYATIQTLAAGAADITATAPLADGSRIKSVTHLLEQAAPARSYTLVLTPATVVVTAGGAAQTVTVAMRRSDGVEEAGDLTNWSWTSDEASFVATPVTDGHSAQVTSPASAYAPGAAVLTACADAPAGGRLCANAAHLRLPLAAADLPRHANFITARRGQCADKSQDGHRQCVVSTNHWEILQAFHRLLPICGMFGICENVILPRPKLGSNS